MTGTGLAEPASEDHPRMSGVDGFARSQSVHRAAGGALRVLPSFRVDCADFSDLKRQKARKVAASSVLTISPISSWLPGVYKPLRCRRPTGTQCAVIDPARERRSVISRQKRASPAQFLALPAEDEVVEVMPE